MDKQLSVREAQELLPRLSQDREFREPLVVEAEGHPRLAILPVEEFRRFQNWERRERVRAHIFATMAERRTLPDWGEAFRLMDDFSQRADLSEDELAGLILRATR